MILIITSKDDVSTTRVINWLVHLGADYLVINEVDFLDSIEITITNKESNFIFMFFKMELILEYKLAKIFL
jgi:hypothetical protein